MAEKVTLAGNPLIHVLRLFDRSSATVTVAAPLILWAGSVLLSLLNATDGGAALWTLLLLASGGCAFVIARSWPHIITTGLLHVLGLLAGSLVLLFALKTGLTRPSWINPNWIASIILMALPFSRLLVCIPALVLTGSRGALLALPVAAISLILYSYIREGSRPTFVFTSAVLLGVISVSLVAVAARPATVLDRLETWRVACTLWLQHPLLGNGPGASIYLLRENHADSLLVTVLLEQGALGLFAVVWSGVVIIRMCFSSPGTPARLALLAFGVHQLIDATLYMPGVAIVAGAALGLLTLRADERRHE